MVGGILNPDEMRCWGRGDEIEYLLEPIHNSTQPRSLTLIWGDSGIGKTTLLEEFQRRVGGGDYLAGIYQCQRDTGADPLLKCLQNLLESRIYTLDEWPTLMVEGLRRVKDRLQNPLELGRLFSETLDAASKAPVVGKWVEVVSKGLEFVSTAAGPGTAIPSPMVERLAPEVFADIVEVLQAALPGRPLIFILDNLSAVAESQAPTAGVTTSTNALLGFVQTQFLKYRHVHFVLSWKHVATTRPSFEELRTTIRQYQGRDRQLSVISDASVSEWADHGFEWFRNASAEERVEVVTIARGLPEVVAQFAAARAIPVSKTHSAGNRCGQKRKIGKTNPPNAFVFNAARARPLGAATLSYRFGVAKSLVGCLEESRGRVEGKSGKSRESRDRLDLLAKL